VTVLDGVVEDKDHTAGDSDPYCIVSAGGAEAQTLTLFNTNEPSWLEALSLGCVSTTAPIRVHCLDFDAFNADDDLIDETLNGWYPSGGRYTLGDATYYVNVDVRFDGATTTARRSKKASSKKAGVDPAAWVVPLVLVFLGAVAWAAWVFKLKARSAMPDYFIPRRPDDLTESEAVACEMGVVQGSSSDAAYRPLV